MNKTRSHVGDDASKDVTTFEETVFLDNTPDCRGHVSLGKKTKHGRAFEADREFNNGFLAGLLTIGFLALFYFLCTHALPEKNKALVIGAVSGTYLSVWLMILAFYFKSPQNLKKVSEKDVAPHAFAAFSLSRLGGFKYTMNREFNSDVLTGIITLGLFFIFYLLWTHDINTGVDETLATLTTGYGSGWLMAMSFRFASSQESARKDASEPSSQDDPTLSPQMTHKSTKRAPKD